MSNDQSDQRNAIYDFVPVLLLHALQVARNILSPCFYMPPYGWRKNIFRFYLEPGDIEKPLAILSGNYLARRS